jgi:hypothetical protein
VNPYMKGGKKTGWASILTFSHVLWLLKANHCSENPGRDWNGKVSEARTSQKTCH